MNVKPTDGSTLESKCRPSRMTQTARLRNKTAPAIGLIATHGDRHTATLKTDKGQGSKTTNTWYTDRDKPAADCWAFSAEEQLSESSTPPHQTKPLKVSRMLVHRFPDLNALPERRQVHHSSVLR